MACLGDGSIRTLMTEAALSMVFCVAKRLWLW